MPAEFTIGYRIDRQDRIISVSESWEAFAEANDGAAVRAEKVIGRPLWDFIQDRNVAQLYRHLAAKARSGHPVEFHYRCDAPTQRRVFRMRIAATPGGGVEFLSRLQSIETRPPMDLLDRQVPRSSAFLRICSWCQRVAFAADEWVEVEVAVEHLGLLQVETLPALTHGICPRCLAEMERLLGDAP